MAGRRWLKHAIGGIYSFAADRLYEPVVVKGAFRLFGGDLNELALEQGHRAVASAGGGPILDMPIGTGYFTIRYSGAHPGVIVGVDIARGMVEETQRAAREVGVANIVPVQADAHSLPFPDGAFAAILCTNGLQVMPGLEASIRELARVLKPGGRLYCSVVTLPLGNALGPRVAEHLPTFARSGADVADEISKAGLFVESIRTERLATLIEASV
ncbi:MAG: class I SAM-dependent methyltransferase [Actinomycetota bacterium]